MQAANEEIAPAVAQIIGMIFPEAESRSLEIGYSTIKQILERKKQTTLLPTPLTILAVRKYFDEISASRGTGSRQKKQNLLESLLGEASPLEAGYLVKMIFGEMQQADILYRLCRYLPERIRGQTIQLIFIRHLRR